MVWIIGLVVTGVGLMLIIGMNLSLLTMKEQWPLRWLDIELVVAAILIGSGLGMTVIGGANSLKAMINKQPAAIRTRPTLAVYTIGIILYSIWRSCEQIGQTVISTSTGAAITIALQVPMLVLAALILVREVPECRLSVAKTMIVKGLAIYTIGIVTRNVVVIVSNIGKAAPYTLVVILIGAALLLPVVALAVLILVLFMGKNETSTDLDNIDQSRNLK
jgi:hypothetical protein